MAVPARRAQGRFIVGAGLAVFLETSLAGAECIGPTLPGPELLDLQLCFPARHSLGVAWTGVEHHPPEPPGLVPVAPFLGQDGEVPQGKVAVDALIDATELVGTLQRQDPPPAGFGLSRLAGFAVEDGLAEMQVGVVGVERQALVGCRQRGGKVALHLVAAGDQGERLPHDRIGGGGAGQAAPQMAQGA